MKNTIHSFNQTGAIELGLSNDDLLFLRWFVDFKECGKMERKYLGEEINNMGYWVSYEKIISDLPILFNNKTSEDKKEQAKIKSANKKKIQRMLDGNLSNVIAKDVSREKDQKGTKVFLGIISDKYSLLIGEEKETKTTGQKCPVPLDKNVQSDKTINDTLKNNKKRKTNKEVKEELLADESLLEFSKEVVEYLNLKSNRNHRYNTVETLKLIKARLEDKYTVEDFKAVIDNKVLSFTGTKYELHLVPKTLFHERHFDTYLNERPRKVKEVKNNSTKIDDDFIAKLKEKNRKENGLA